MYRFWAIFKIVTSRKFPTNPVQNRAPIDISNKNTLGLRQDGRVLYSFCSSGCCQGFRFWESPVAVTSFDFGGDLAPCPTKMKNISNQFHQKRAWKYGCYGVYWWTVGSVSLSLPLWIDKPLRKSCFSCLVSVISSKNMRPICDDIPDWFYCGESINQRIIVEWFIVKNKSCIQETHLPEPSNEFGSIMWTRKLFPNSIELCRGRIRTDKISVWQFTKKSLSDLNMNLDHHRKLNNSHLCHFYRK